jgi:hypothetical protein
MIFPVNAKRWNRNIERAYPETLNKFRIYFTAPTTSMLNSGTGQEVLAFEVVENSFNNKFSVEGSDQTE